MAEKVTPRKVQLTVKRGFERLRRYRKARAMFIKEYVGQYYKNGSGITGEEPINLIFSAIRAIVPNLVMQNPVNLVTTRYFNQKDYAELLGLGLNQVQEDMKLKATLRAWIVSALFAFGVVKTGISATGGLLKLDDTRVDPGQIYTSLVDLDNFVFDSVCTNIHESTFFGDRIRVPRQTLLDTDGYDHDLVRKLPTSKVLGSNANENLTRQNAAIIETYTLQDYVDVVELWVPEAGTMVTIPDPEQFITDKYLKIDEYYGPDSGPYTLLSFTPPVPGNPLPVSPVSIIYDLHKASNRVFQKMMDQSEAQKDLVAYVPAAADEAEDAVEARDGDAIAVSDISNIKVLSMGGQNRINEVMVGELQTWFNYMAGNPDQMAGNQQMTGGKESATKSQIMQGNASISIEDARDILNDAVSDVSSKQAWFLHTDPLIELPLTKRVTRDKQIQLVLTPEQRTGDYLDFTFNIKSRSMSKMDPSVRSKRIAEFATNMMPSIVNAAMVAMQMGVPFNVQRAITDLAEEYGIQDLVMDWFDDPEFEQKMARMQAMGPQNPGKAGGGGVMSNEGVVQQGGFPGQRPVATQQQEFNQQSQATAADAQSVNKGVY